MSPRRELAFALLALWLACAPVWAPTVPPVNGSRHAVAHPVVFVPGVTGSELVDPRDGTVVWGATTQLLRPRDGGHRLVLPLAVGAAAGAEHPQAGYVASRPLWQLRLPFWTKRIYRPLVEHFARHGYPLGDFDSPRPGDGLFFLNYDWRRDNMAAVRSLHRRLEALHAARGGELAVDLICQSNAGKICRYLAKYGALDLDQAGAGEAPERSYRVRKLILVGASNNGALRVLQMLTQGRSYIPLIGRKLEPETVFSLRPLFADLPVGRDDLFFDSAGETVPVDLFDPAAWIEYGWSIFDPDVEARLAKSPRPDLFGTRDDRLAYLTVQLEKSQRTQRLLTSDAAGFPDELRYYRLENESSPTIDGALLVREDNRWRTYFLGDRPVSADARLKDLSSAPGDGHATLASQRQLSPQEEAALADAALIEGGHFEMLIEPQGLGALIRFLAD